MLFSFRSLIATVLVLQTFCSSAQTKVAVIGGGIAGVSSAYYITEFDSTAQIILFEKEAKLGGNAQTVLIKNKLGESVAVDAGPQYFVEGPWNDYIDFLKKTLGPNPYQSESMAGTLLIQREKESKPVLVSPLGMKLRGEKLGKLLKFKRFNKEAYLMYKHPEKWRGITIETWVKGLKFEESYKNEIIYPFLAASLGTSIGEIKGTSAVDIVKLFAFRKPKASNKFKVMSEGMGTLIERVGKKISSQNLEIRCSSPVMKVVRSKEKWLVTYSKNGTLETELVDFVVFATHADQAAKILNQEPGLSEITQTLKHLTYFEAKIALHSDSGFVNNEKPSFLNIITNDSNQLVSSTMNLSMISDRLSGIYKSWVNSEAVSELKASGKLLHIVSFWHPLITTKFVEQLAVLSSKTAEIPSLYLSGGWSEGLETQNSAVISGQHALDKYKIFFSSKPKY